MNEPRVFVVIPVHNREQLTRQCLRSLDVQSYPSITLIVVDDGSTDGTAAALDSSFPNVVVLHGDGDLWWTGATALGVDWVLGRCATEDYVVTLNNDTTVDPEYVETLVRVCRREGDRVVVGSVGIDSRDRDTIVDGGPLVNWFTAKGGSMHIRESLRECVARGVLETRPDFLSGRGTLIPVSCFRAVGNFDAKRLPQYAADYEFSARAGRADYRLIMCYEAPVYSQVESTGITTRHGRLPWGQFFKMFVSRRSPACLLYRWRFARMAAPRCLAPTFILADSVRVIGGAIRDQLGGAAR